MRDNIPQSLESDNRENENRENNINKKIEEIIENITLLKNSEQYEFGARNQSTEAIEEKKLFQETAYYEDAIKYLSKIFFNEEEIKVKEFILNKIKEIIKLSSVNSAAFFAFLTEDVFFSEGQDEINFYMKIQGNKFKAFGLEDLSSACENYILGEHMKAVNSFEEYTDKNMNNQNKHFATARIAAKIMEKDGNTEKAKQLYSKYADEMKNKSYFHHSSISPDLRYLLALKKAGRIDELKKELEWGENLVNKYIGVGNIEDIINYIGVFEFLGTQDKAELLRNKALLLINTIKINNSPTNRILVTSYFERIGMIKEAIEENEKILKEQEKYGNGFLKFIKLRLLKKKGEITDEEKQKLEEEIINDKMILTYFSYISSNYFLNKGDYETAFDLIRLKSKARDIHYKKVEDLKP